MENTILFSPIGLTDPISNYHDGAMLHICRKYKPKKVYLYLSDEVLSLSDRDDRYRATIKLLGEHIDHVFEAEEIRRVGLKDVQKFDYFYSDFEQILNRIESENPDSQILLNVSSGTPAMKSTLQIITALSEGRYTAIQVSTPEYKSNPSKRDDPYEYDIIAAWECNQDNSPKYIDRTSISEHINLLARVKKEIICKHIDVYDYNAALSIAEGISEHLSDNAMKLLRAANYRIRLNHRGIQKELEATNFDILPVKQGDERYIFEYLLWMKIKQQRCELVDFIRGITPVVMDLFEKILENECKINIHEYCKKESKIDDEVYKLTTAKLSRNKAGKEILGILNSYFKPYNDKILTSAQLAIILDAKLNDRKLADDVWEMRNIEKRLRNIAAHEIVSVSEDWLINRSNKSSSAIMDLLKKIAESSGITIKPHYWNSYEDMNALIKEYL